MARLNLDLSDYDAMDDFGPVPPGDYVVTVVNSEVTHSKAGNLMAILTFEVAGPTHAGRKLWDYYVLNNDVAMRRLKSLAQAGGHPNPNFIRDTEELHGLQCIVRVTVEEQEGYSPKNKIVAFKPTKKPDAAPASATQQRKSVPPWEAAQS